eukprot:gene31773-38404_t
MTTTACQPLYQYADFMNQLAPVDVVLQALRTEEPDWPSTAAQRRFAIAARAVEPFDRPVRYMKHLLRTLWTDIEKAEIEPDDELAELRVRISCEISDELDSGYCFYSPLLSFPAASSPSALPLRVFRAHNEVGCRVWTAGVFLA